MIPEQGVKALMHDGKEKVLGNGALYKKATKHDVCVRRFWPFKLI
jgi:hypothetical protein